MRSVRPPPKVVLKPPAHLFEPNPNTQVESPRDRVQARVSEPVYRNPIPAYEVPIKRQPVVAPPSNKPEQEPSYNFDDDVKEQMRILEKQILEKMLKETEAKGKDKDKTPSYDHPPERIKKNIHKDHFAQVDEPVSLKDWKSKGYPSEYAYAKDLGLLNAKKDPPAYPPVHPPAQEMPINYDSNPSRARGKGAIDNLYGANKDINQKEASQQSYSHHLQQQVEDHRLRKEKELMENREQSSNGQFNDHLQNKPIARGKGGGQGLENLYGNNDRSDNNGNNKAASDYGNYLQQQMEEQRRVKEMEQLEIRRRDGDEGAEFYAKLKNKPIARGKGGGQGIENLYGNDDDPYEKAAQQQDYASYLQRQVCFVYRRIL